jgi:hypothetical protein
LLCHKGFEPSNFKTFEFESLAKLVASVVTAFLAVDPPKPPKPPSSSFPAFSKLPTFDSSSFLNSCNFSLLY